MLNVSTLIDPQHTLGVVIAIVIAIVIVIAIAIVIVLVMLGTTKVIRRENRLWVPSAFSL